MKRLTLTAALVAAVLLCGASTLRYIGRADPSPAPAPTAHAGPACTPTYPRGLKVHGTKKHPIPLCVNGDLQSTWGGCTSRFAT